MALIAGGAAPYAPPLTVIEMLDRYRDRGLQTPITTDILERAGVPESLSQRTLQALRLLDLIQKDGQPSPELERLARVPSEEWKKGMQDLLVAAYSEVWAFVDPSKDTIDRVRDAFRPFNPRGQQERMVTLFLGLCEWAGMDVTAASKKKPGGPVAEGQRGATRSQRAEKPPTARATTQRRQTKGQGPPLAQEPTPEGIPPGLVGLLRQLPSDGRGWDKTARDSFVSAFTAVLDFTVPIRTEYDIDPGGDADEDDQ